MYRQILSDPNQRDLQRIVWKTSADASVKVYKLSTVTYGTVSAPFLATRTLKALADEERKDFPKAADVICSDIYMDDILSGEATIEDAKKLQTQICELFLRAGFELHKWVSNSLDLLQQWSPTPGPWTGTGPWIKWYRAAQGTLNYFHLYKLLFNLTVFLQIL
ncbi:hypothetical protein AVEN_119102-1 [Araneus ventricosus]|uniref:Reverse transcriptase domain-containing protein n=1 Tax=Araneus ventricosus TaxID=182803 RepID=A0A4Y2BKD2_ARAVE|nr:hypothetical protein AVEN_119102-1 [Araneus ventricosus]